MVDVDEANVGVHGHMAEVTVGEVVGWNAPRFKLEVVLRVRIVVEERRDAVDQSVLLAVAGNRLAERCLGGCGAVERRELAQRVIPTVAVEHRLVLDRQCAAWGKEDERIQSLGDSIDPGGWRRDEARAGHYPPRTKASAARITAAVCL